ncbi:MAG: primase C-terminal domain-containing protein [Nitrospiraceae bacterium]|nr:primase C-terminal domain-containing protein [Nitrospiraceae bacterium]
MPAIFIPLKQFNDGEDGDKLLPMPISKGQRDDTLFRHACRIRQISTLRGIKLDLERVLQEVNALFCAPPLFPHEVRQKIQSAERYPVLGEVELDSIKQNGIETLHDLLGPIKNTDIANAKRLVYWHGRDLKYTKARGWLAWDGRRWSPDKKLAEGMAKKTAAAIYDEIRHGGSEK